MSNVHYMSVPACLHMCLMLPSCVAVLVCACVCVNGCLSLDVFANVWFCFGFTVHMLVLQWLQNSNGGAT